MIHPYNFYNNPGANLLQLKNQFSGSFTLIFLAIMAIELESRYNPQNTESKWYEIWEKSGSFSPDFQGSSRSGSPFTIVIPPPNVTGQLHVGHALNQSIQDALVRAARKRGKDTLWLPGTDHAGIATQARVEKMLAETEKISRHDLGREKFLERVWEWKEKYGNAIMRQMRIFGGSMDWSRERFTMDEGLSKAVAAAFVKLYKEGLIYRGTRMVNWDPVAHTVLSDLEVDYEENHKGELWSFAYPLSSGEGEIVVATTRPETMLGDAAVAVHPDDERYKHLIGHTVKHPLLKDRHIPIIGDAILVDPSFGTGAVKVTPAHDPNDYETGKRHDLEFITIFDEKAAINENGGSYRGLDRFEARKKIKADLEALGLARGSRENIMALGKSQRSGAVVEPMISTQWFVKIQPLAVPAIAAVEEGRIRFLQKQYENLYFAWMREIRDWCISRQLWWGHRIPAWYGPDETVFVEESEKAAREAARKHFGHDVELRQEEDVLDTWFSSALWPFSTLGWPDQTPDLKRFYPGTVLVTAFDIIFFWVARMIMMGLHLAGEVPFRDVYIHGLMRDEKGRKISKSLGNNIDPAEVIAEYGADAYRFFLLSTLAEGKDILYSENRLKGYQNFTNKIWNSSRFVLMNLPDQFAPAADAADLARFKLESEDFWILERLNAAISTVGKNIDDYKFQPATEAVYSFIWNNFCDWYIEFIKPRLYGKAGEESAEAARQTAFFVLRSMLGILHPFMPFLSEEIYSYLNQLKKPADEKEKLLITSDWPSVSDLKSLSPRAEETARALELIQEAIQCARSVRAEAGLPPDKKVPLIIRTSSGIMQELVKEKEAAILRLAQAESIVVTASHSAGKFDAMEPFSEGEVFIPLEGVIDIPKETARLEADQKKLKTAADALDKKLSNPGFTDKAPADVVEKEREKLEDLRSRLSAVEASIKRLKK